MRAVVLTDPNRPLALEEVSPLAMGPGDVRIRLEAAGVCHSDLTTSRLPTASPAIMGHEGAGTVLAVGDDVTRVKIGQRVIASYVPSCGKCFHCVRAEWTQCDRIAQGIATVRGKLGEADVTAKGGLGTWAEEMVITESQVVPVDTELPWEQLALIGCGVTTGAGAALWSAKVFPGATVAVFGCGGVGLFAIQGARIAGADQIIAVDPLESKRRWSEAVGATHTVDPNAADPVEQIRELTGGRGTDFSFEVVGHPTVMLQVYNSVRKRGTAVIVGMPAPDAVLPLPVGAMFHGERRLMGSFCGSAQSLLAMPTLVRYAEQGRLDIASAVSKRIAIDETQGALDALEHGEVLRSVIVPS
jgi:S-(hydroxymethyl)glutathione dehydrogenase/alcohol dehydrogenase